MHHAFFGETLMCTSISNYCFGEFRTGATLQITIFNFILKNNFCFLEWNQSSERRRSATSLSPRFQRNDSFARSGSLNRLGNSSENSFRPCSSEETFARFDEDDYLESLSISCHDRLQNLGYALRELPESGREGAGNKQFETIVLGLVNQFQQMEQEVGVLSDSLRKLVENSFCHEIHSIGPIEEASQCYAGKKK